jgi:hypothetical protein
MTNNFNPKEMQSRWEKLKAAGKVPQLADVLKVIQAQIDEINNAPSAGWCDEPSYTTLRGFPICSCCGRSTRQKGRLVCRPCESGTRLLLTAEDRRWLREIKVKVPR